MGLSDWFSYIWGLCSCSFSGLRRRQPSSNSEPKWTIAQANAAEKAFRDFKLPAERRFQYSQLNPGEIRLLKISLPAKCESMLGLELMRTSLDSAPPYRAISYCWGKDQAYRKVPIIDSGDTDTHDAHTRQGQQSWIGVTESLAQMLAYLPRHCIQSSNTPSYIWIDQICINQTEVDDKEKAHQIKLMGKIYSQATQVLIWLGTGPDPAAAERIVNTNILGKSPISTEEKDAIEFVWTNYWFERTWVVQESCLARDRQLLVGLHAMSWGFTAKQVSTQVFAADLPSLSIGVDPFAISHHIAAVSMWQKFEKMSDDRNVSRGILLCSFLSRFGRYLEAGDSRDRVLAFMSLWNPPSFDIRATPGECPHQVYTRFARSLVKDTKRLDLLAALRPPIRDNPAADTSQPSWVPKWERGSKRDEEETNPPSPLMAATYSSTTLKPLSIGPDRFRPSRTESLLTPSEIQWKASYPHEEHKDVSKENLTLTTRGKIICRVQVVFPPITNRPQPMSKHAIEQFQLSLNSNKASINIQEAMETIIECTELGRTNEISRSGILSDFQRLSSNISPGLADSQDEDLGPETSYALSTKLFNSTGRRFFTTTWPDDRPEETQTLHGLGPGWMEIGDDIAILHGARFPVILRQYNDRSQTYQVVGDCCIPKIMRGEAVNWKEAEADDILLV